MPGSTLARDGAQVRHVVTRVAKGDDFSPEELDLALDQLEQFECWVPYFELLNRMTSQRGVIQLSYFIRQARVQNLFIENVFAAADTCALAVDKLKLTFDDMQYRILPSVIRHEDWAAEAVILQATVDRFAETRDKIRCLERLCLLFEKKTHNEERLTSSYERLLSLDPYNVKALRYFKMAYAQAGSWQQVTVVLKKLLQCSAHPQDVFRVAQELAAVLLYQLDKPKQAIELLEKHCSESPLDTSMIHFDAYFRMDNLHGCLRVLNGCLSKVSEPGRKAILHFKCAGLFEQLEEWDSAEEHYRAAARDEPDFLEALERLVVLSIRKRSWQDVDHFLEQMRLALRDGDLDQRLEDAVVRLRQGYRGESARKS